MFERPITPALNEEEVNRLRVLLDSDIGLDRQIEDKLAAAVEEAKRPRFRPTTPDTGKRVRIG